MNYYTITRPIRGGPSLSEKTRSWHKLHRDTVPLIHTCSMRLLSIAASHIKALFPSIRASRTTGLALSPKNIRAIYRSPQDITAENHEAILVTGTFALAFIPPPAGQGPDTRLSPLGTRHREAHRLPSDLQGTPNFELCHHRH